jgi:hypothetical protein
MGPSPVCPFHDCEVVKGLLLKFCASKATIILCIILMDVAPWYWYIQVKSLAGIAEYKPLKDAEISRDDFLAL